MKQNRIIFIIFLSILLSSCYQTKNIPEEEYLYAGIKDVAYGHRLGEKKKAQNDSTGIILAGYNAYNAVSEILKGGSTAAITTNDQRELSKEEKDSLKRAEVRDKAVSSAVETEVRSVIAYAPNGAVMGSSKITQPFTPGLWIWNRYVYSDSKFGNWMLDKFSKSPKYISTANPKVRCQVATNTLHNYGYFHADVTYRIEDHKNPKKKKISYQILPKELFHLGGIEYKNFGKSDSLVRSNVTGSLLHRDDAFSVATLDNERQRICDILRNNGYYFFRPDYITYKADTIMQPLKVQLQVIPSPMTPEEAKHPYHIGNTTITILKNNVFNLTDSVERNNIKFRWSGGKKAQNGKRGKSPLKFMAIRKFLYHKHGDLYNKDIQKLTISRLASMGIFSMLKMDYVQRDSSATGQDTLDVRIMAILDKPYDSEFEGKVTAKTNGQVGPGLAYSISKRNAFGGAETLTFGVNGSYEWQTGANIKGSNSLLNSWELGGNLNLSYPRFMFFGMGRKLNRRIESTTKFKIDAKWQNRSGYYGIVSVGGRAVWTFRKKENMLHEFTPFHLEYRQLLSRTERFDSIVAENKALYTSLQNQFTPSMEYSFTWTNTNTSRNKYDFRLDLKEAGNLTSCIYAIFGKGFNKKGKSLFGVPFSQFVKITADWSCKHYFTPRNILVFHTRLGYLHSYGNSYDAPYGDLYYAGGANSIRSFGIRSIGPGSFNPIQNNYSYLNQVGNISFEMNLEFRFPIIGNLNGAVFIDSGNVWLDHEDETRPGGLFKWKNFPKELALGTGLGIRYDLDILVLRFDMGFGIHAPYDTGKSGYYNMPNFGKSIGYHIAIGYPF